MVIVVRILLVAVIMVVVTNGGVGIDTGDGPATGRGH